MCGIFSLFNYFNSGLCDEKTMKEFTKLLNRLFKNGKNRGPEYSTLKHIKEIHSFLGFHRLAINGLNDESHQPIINDDMILICNGEIYNWEDLTKTHGFTMKTQSDCEVIMHCYRKYGIKTTLRMLDGVFAFVLIDYQDRTNIQMHVGRDPFGVRPLFYYKYKNGVFGFGSEIKMIKDEEDKFDGYFGELLKIIQYPPGTYSSYLLDLEKNDSADKNEHGKWKRYVVKEKYFSLPNLELIKTEEVALEYIRETLIEAVNKRVQNCERNIACLLSGGLDSSLICALVQKMYKALHCKNIDTYSIGLPGSVDLKYAKQVADFIGSNHHEIVVSEEDFLNAIPDVVKQIESYDTTTVRASVGNYLVAKYIKENSENKVIFNGDGSDEVCGGYLYFHKAPNSFEFDNECRRLLDDISYFDVLRSDRTIASNGLEARTPFLDKNFVTSYFLIEKVLRNFNNNKKCEKYLLRKAFENKNILPENVLWRTKEAFSDGVSSEKKAWYEIIQEHIGYSKINKQWDSDVHNRPDTLEKAYYRQLFEETYGEKYVETIPYFWMPNFIESNDASARTLNIYNKLQGQQ